MSNLSIEAQQKWGHLPHFTQRTATEWSAACPKCGDSQHIGNEKPDRFRIMAPVKQGENWRGWCRRCQFMEFVDDNQRQKPLTLVEIIQARREQERLRREEQERLRKKIESLQEQAYWRGWHDAMTTVHRDLWHKAGIPDYFIDYYNLGYCLDHRYIWQGQEYHCPTMTIPHFTFGGQIVNIQHRLMSPVAGAGKYRQMAGIPAAMFLTEWECDKLEKTVLVVEGAKKAIVTCMHVGTGWQGGNMSVVGVPSKTPGKAILGQLADAETIFLALDPDAYFGKDPAVQQVAKELGADRVRLVRLPVKPDDFFTAYGGDGDDFRAFMQRARACV